MTDQSDIAWCADAEGLNACLERLKQPMIIGIAGDSGSGKTIYSEGIRKMFGDAIVSTINMDGYHKETRAQRKISGKSPLDPSENNLSLLVSHLQSLRTNQTVRVPVYNHETGEFDNPVDLKPTKIIIVEGLHALYPEIMPFLDFSIYVDPTRQVKWEWKYKRDVTVRHHSADSLLKEMLAREAYYKRFIDFQKTQANIVLKIYNSKLENYAKYEFNCTIPSFCYKMELIIQISKQYLANLPITFDFGDIMRECKFPFLLAAVPSIYWGKEVVVVHIDGTFSKATIYSLKDKIEHLTGVPMDQAVHAENIAGMPNSDQFYSSTKFAQLLIAWRFLEELKYKM